MSFDPFGHLGEKFSCPCCGSVHELPVKKIVVEEGALGEVGAVARELELGKRVLIVADENTWKVAGKDLSGELAGNGFDVKNIFLPNDAYEGHPIADDVNSAFVAGKLGEIDFLVAVGGGTVIDVTKQAGFLKRKPLIVFPTAPSMNGIVSNIAALKINGVKTTSPIAPPVAAVCDLNVLCEAPSEMVASGFADLASKPTSFTDWRLSSKVKGDDYCSLPRETAKNYEAKCSKKAKEIGERRKSGIEILTLALINSGFSMTLAGSSAPASGGEHLLSHLWDMTARQNHRKTGWHGQQVGVATMIIAKLYEELLSCDESEFDLGALEKNYSSEENVRSSFSRVYGEKLAAEIMPHYSKKHMAWNEKKKELEPILEEWGAFTKEMKAYTEKWTSIQSKLSAVGSALNSRGLGLKKGEMENAFFYARFIRARYTVLDFASELGVLNGQNAKKILEETRVLE